MMKKLESCFMMNSLRDKLYKFYQSYKDRDRINELDFQITKNECALSSDNVLLNNYKTEEEALIEQIKNGINKDSNLRNLQRVKFLIKNVEDKIVIYNRNIKSNLAILNKLIQIDITKTDLDVNEIENINISHEEKMDSHYEKVSAILDVDNEDLLKSQEEKELKDLENEIMNSDEVKVSKNKKYVNVNKIVDDIENDLETNCNEDEEDDNFEFEED